MIPVSLNSSRSFIHVHTFLSAIFMARHRWAYTHGGRTAAIYSQCGESDGQDTLYPYHRPLAADGHRSTFESVLLQASKCKQSVVIHVRVIKST